MKTKVCSTCKSIIEICNFTKDKNKRDGLKINCIECCKTLYNNYKDKNYLKESERGKKYNKEKRIINKEDIKEYKKKYYQENKESIELKRKDYRTSNKIRLNEIRKKNTIKYLNEKIGNSIRTSLKNNGFRKSSRTHEILGCSSQDLKIYLESKFEDWMSWENHGKYNGELNYGWDIDHIIPISSVNSEEDIIKLNHHTNLQPLCSYVNRYIKANKIIN